MIPGHYLGGWVIFYIRRMLYGQKIYSQCYILLRDEKCGNPHFIGCIEAKEKRMDRVGDIV